MGVSKKKVISIALREATLKRKLRRHLNKLGFQKAKDGTLRIEGSGKEVVRNLHNFQREERLKANSKFVSLNESKLFKHFANGRDVDPSKISPVLERISANTWQSDLFRFASLTWSVPVSNGFGRRLRYLIWDEYNNKLIGLIALGDPVFNLSVRDKLIGWNVSARKDRLVNILDAYVLGALPPYNFLLGGKMMACLVRSREIYSDFRNKYGATTGIISQKKKKARLLYVTTSSSMGRSSVYNRLKLNGFWYFQSIGYTEGWGHFHIPDKLFLELRDYLRKIKHPYADFHRFGQGPNWRLRTTRAALDSLGFKRGLLRHGIHREVFICTLADNAKKILRTGNGKPDISSLLSVREVAELAIDRWVLPRSKRRPEYQYWVRDELAELFAKKKRLMKSRTSKIS